MVKILNTYPQMQILRTLSLSCERQRLTFKPFSPRIMRTLETAALVFTMRQFEGHIESEIVNEQVKYEEMRQWVPPLAQVFQFAFTISFIICARSRTQWRSLSPMPMPAFAVIDMSDKSEKSLSHGCLISSAWHIFHIGAIFIPKLDLASPA